MATESSVSVQLQYFYITVPEHTALTCIMLSVLYQCHNIGSANPSGGVC